MKTWTNAEFKHGLPEGPWMQEFDKAQWVDPETDLDCMMRRHPTSGHWCGYVGVQPGHPLHGVNYSDMECSISVHGGITFAEGCQEDGDEATAICHVPEPGRSDNVWWLGFDCAHYQDLSPGIHRYLSWKSECVYRDANYVQRECERLALQISKVEEQKKL